MTHNIDLEQALSALDSYNYDQKQSSSLEQSRNKNQMRKYLQSLNYSLKRLVILQDTVNEMVEEENQRLILQENIQTFKTKIINLSREYNMTYDEVLQVMAKR
ncbi:hypothetical protein D5R81_12120 [Parashewanella spongiae]|uniref:Uncharacterized protein n=1 Tax=Parashewanella spongiae TaxID=342950 RepID=A0A3A6U504_9GAMM|nr:hypothetical protein [Parashewanella spongiae]MCL1078678.1 hypothetical protein [Parashewanella spongiae]RJY12949.1 hypothetical protein D5R81_12120 [Parashewanella spongiae]